jgi:hypothetical protein
MAALSSQAPLLGAWLSQRFEEAAFLIQPPMLHLAEIIA